jgi:FlaA1/EpsC-like NDP-sugar epimerase
MERNPSEAIKNNVFGSRNVADCADKYGAERFVLISSDKAVNPTSVMGATKRIAEMYVQSLNTTSNTKFSAVRFGNVLGSRGSVIPAFKQQIAAGGPVTVTHPEMVRYFMTIPEAVQLVIQSGSFAKGGEVFVLDMGEPVKILTLAEDLITLSGYEPYKDINIVFSGIREGEKLYEELLTAEENLGSTQHDRIFIGKPNVISQNQLELEFKRLERVLSEEPDAIREVINQIVPMQPVAQAAIS